MKVKRGKINIKRLYLVLFLVVGMTMPGYCLAAEKRLGTLAELALYTGADRQQILEAGAKKEGKVLFYSTPNVALSSVVPAFQKKYPFIKVDVWGTNSREVLTRAIEEFRANSHRMDFILGAQATMIAIQRVGIVQPFISPNLAQIEDEAKTNAAGGGVLAVAFRSQGIGFGYNTKMLSKDQLPKTYHDLTDPKWKGKLALIPGEIGVNGMSAIHRNYGEDLLKKIAAQGFPVQTISSRGLLELIIAGEFAASPSMTDANVHTAKLRGAPVAWIPLEPVFAQIGQIAVAKTAPNPHAALLFADFILTKEGGEIHRGHGFDSFRKDVAPVGQRYKKYFGPNTVEGFKEDSAMFQKLFLKK